MDELYEQEAKLKINICKSKQEYIESVELLKLQPNSFLYFKDANLNSVMCSWARKLLDTPIY